MTHFVSYETAKQELTWYFDLAGEEGAAVFVTNMSGPGYELLEKRIERGDESFGGDNTFVTAEDARRLSREFDIEIDDL